MAAELKASGISPDTSESAILLQDITEQFYESEKNADEKKEKLQQDAVKEKEMKRQSLETFTQTKKRLGDTSELQEAKRLEF